MGIVLFERGLSGAKPGLSTPKEGRPVSSPRYRESDYLDLRLKLFRCCFELIKDASSFLSLS